VRFRICFVFCDVLALLSESAHPSDDGHAAVIILKKKTSELHYRNIAMLGVGSQLSGGFSLKPQSSLQTLTAAVSG
jgi:hypothetical protein